MDDGSLGSIFLGLGLASILLAIALTGVLMASLGVMLRQANGSFLPDTLALSPSVERLRSLTPDPQLTAGVLRLFLALFATLLTSLFAISLGLVGWGVALAFGLLLLAFLGLEKGAQLLGRRYADRVAPMGARLLLGLTVVARPVVRRLPLEREAGSARSLLEPLPSYEPPEHTTDGAASPGRGEVKMLLRAILNLEKTQVREVLVPRVDVVAVEVEEPPGRVVELALTHGYSRVPVYESSIDQIVGIIYVRDLVRYLQEGTLGRVTLRELARPTMFVPESKRVYELLREFQERRVHIAIVVDEYGGTAGLVTIEDLLEEIVGEIEDEFDREEPKVQLLGDGEAIVDARLSLDDLKENLGVEIEGHGFETVGGFVYSQLGRVPNPGDQFTAAGVHTEVLSTTGRRIRKVRVSRQEDNPQKEPTTSS